MFNILYIFHYIYEWGKLYIKQYNEQRLLREEEERAAKIKELRELEERRELERINRQIERNEFIERMKKRAKKNKLDECTKYQLLTFCSYMDIRVDGRRKKDYIISRIQDYLAPFSDELNNEPGDDRCPVCYEENIKIYVLYPCGHMYCKLCIYKFEKKCPACSSIIKDFIKYYKD